MRFDDIFPLSEGTCAGRTLQPFFGFLGTFLASFAGSFGLRAVLEYLYNTAKHAITGGGEEEEEETDFEGGTFEFQIIKTAFLGTCQAAGTLLGVLQNQECACGWLRPALTAMVIFWLLCLPLGLIVFLSYRFRRQVKSKAIQFRRDNEATFAMYISKVLAATPSTYSEPFAYPPVVHVTIKSLLALGIAVCAMMAIRASTAAYHEGKTVVESAIEAGVLWGATLLMYAMVVAMNFGRRTTVMITNCFAVAGGKQYLMAEGGAIEVRDCTRSGCFSCFSPLCTWLKAKIEAITDAETLDCLRCRGRWVKSDKMAMFYESYNGLRGLNYCIFLLVKAVIIGIVLTNDQGVIVGPIAKVWIIATLYIVDAVHQIFYSPDQDAINGMKIGLQQALQALIMFIAALTTSGAISEDRGVNACINLSVVQVSLAIPEQLWGTVSNVVKKKGNPDEYEFKMTQKQLNASNVKAPSIIKRGAMAKQLYSEFQLLKPHVIDKETKLLLKKLLSHPTTITNMDSLFPYFIPAFFNEHLFSPAVKIFLGVQKKSLELNSMADAAKIVDEVLENEWEDCLDLSAGMDSLMSLQATWNGTCFLHAASYAGDKSDSTPVHQGQSSRSDSMKQAGSEQHVMQCPLDYNMFLDQLLTKAISQEGFEEAFENVMPEPVQVAVNKVIPALKGKRVHDSDFETPHEKWNVTEKVMLFFMAVMGLLALSILTAMGMSSDCGCVCALGETPKYTWGISFGLVSALPIALFALGLTAFYVVSQNGEVQPYLATPPLSARPPLPSHDSALPAQDERAPRVSICEVNMVQDLVFQPFVPVPVTNSVDGILQPSGLHELPPNYYSQYFEALDYYIPPKSTHGQ